MTFLRGLFQLYSHRELIWQLTVREMQQRYRGSYLGALWSLVTPLALLTVYTFVFSVVFDGRWGDRNRPGEFVLTLFAGLLAFNVFGECVTRAPGLIVAVPSYVKKVVFPLEILPVVVLASALINSAIYVALLLAGSLILWGQLASTAIFLPLLYLPLSCLTLGLAWFLASLGVFVRDLTPGITIAVQIIFFLSPVFYPPESVPEPWRWIIRVNPLTTILNGFRQVLLWESAPDWRAWLAVVVFSLVTLVAGYYWFARAKPSFADVV